MRAGRSRSGRAASAAACSAQKRRREMRVSATLIPKSLLRILDYSIEGLSALQCVKGRGAGPHPHEGGQVQVGAHR